MVFSGHPSILVNNIQKPRSNKVFNKRYKQVQILIKNMYYCYLPNIDIIYNETHQMFAADSMTVF